MHCGYIDSLEGVKLRNEEKVYSYLNELNIEFESIKHEPMFKSNDLAKEFKDVDMLDIKNLFLRDDKGKNHYLVIMPYLKPLDIKSLAKKIGTKRMSFASKERLMRYLNVKPGAVSVFNLINDVHHEVIVILDQATFSHPRVGFHPNTNTETLIFSREDLKRLIESFNNPIEIMDI